MSRPLVGGQALIEGVMMKGPKKIAWAARKPNGRIVTHSFRWKSIAMSGVFSLPFLRGIVFLFEMLVIGMKALTWSASQQDEEETLGKWELALTIVISLCLALLIFVGIPYIAAWFAVGPTPTSVHFNIFDGIVRLALFIGYIWAIGLTKDIRRLFQYHGAEHMAVHCHEAALPMTVKNVKKFSTIHPRCGTSLLVYVIGISIVAFSLIRTDVWYYNVLLRLLIVPLIGGVGYELLRLAARNEKNKLLWVLALPGKLTQRMTTRKPDGKQIEVAIASLKAAMR